MPKLISLFLLLSLLLLVALSLASCTEYIPEDEGTADKSDLPEDEGEKNEQPTLVAPTLKDFGHRRAKKFSQIEYKRPDISALSSKTLELCEGIKNSEISYENSLLEIKKIDAELTSLLTSIRYVSVKHSENLLDEYWTGENSYLTESYPSYKKALEELLVSCAQSEYADSYEKDAFGEGFVEKYKDGTVITDTLVTLLEREAELENGYTALSEDTIVITYKIFTDTYNNILAFYEEHYGKNTLSYKSAMAECELLYKKELSKKQIEIFTELIKVRRDIADELGMTSYIEYVYDTRGYDYTPAMMLKYLSEIKSGILPIYSILDYYLFQTYFNTTKEISLDRISLINNGYYASFGISEEYADIYAYMLGYELFSIEPYTKDGRAETSFTTYLDNYDSPFLFVGCDGNITDYMTLSHEFGHFIDGFINDGENTTLALMEISSTAYELLSIIPLSKNIGSDGAKYLYYSKVKDCLTSIIFQGFYALFEHYAYAIPKDKISEATLTEAMVKAATDIGLNADALSVKEESGIFSRLDYVFVHHLFTEPLYVEAYALSSLTSLDIFYTELEKSGAGISAYVDLVCRDEGDLSFEEFLIDAGLKSPFSEGYLKEIADKIHLNIFGTYLYEKRKAA